MPFALGSSSPSMPLREVVDLDMSPARAEETRAKIARALEGASKHHSSALKRVATTGASSTSLLRYMAMLVNWGWRYVPEEDVNLMLSLRPNLLSTMAALNIKGTLGALAICQFSLDLKARVDDANRKLRAARAKLQAKASNLETATEAQVATHAKVEVLQEALRVSLEDREANASRLATEQREKVDLLAKAAKLEARANEAEAHLAEAEVRAVEAEARSGEAKTKVAGIKAEIPVREAAAVDAYKASKGHLAELEETFSAGFQNCQEEVQCRYLELDLSYLDEDAAEVPEATAFDAEEPSQP